MIDKREPQWVLDIPELRTRPLAYIEMKKNASLRRQILHMIHDLLGTATRMRNHPCASEILNQMWIRRRRIFYDRWDHRLDHQTFCEVFGMIRNVFKNALIRANVVLSSHISEDKDYYNVDRPIPDDIE